MPQSETWILIFIKYTGSEHRVFLCVHANTTKPVRNSTNTKCTQTLRYSWNHLSNLRGLMFSALIRGCYRIRQTSREWKRKSKRKREQEGGRLQMQGTVKEWGRVDLTAFCVFCLVSVATASIILRHFTGQNITKTILCVSSHTSSACYECVFVCA